MESELGKWMLVIIACVLAAICTVFIVLSSRNLDIIYSNDIGTATLVLDNKSGANGFKWEKGDDDFIIEGFGSEISGRLITKADAETLDAEHYSDIAYNTVSVLGQLGFEFVEQEYYAHCVPIADSNLYLLLKSRGDVTPVYKAEQHLSVSDVKEIKEATTK